MLVIEDLHFSYGEKKILENLSLHVKRGEIVALIGMSGSGKTTLFKLISGLLTSSKGRIQVAGETLRAGSARTTYMQQEDLLLPWRTVMENLMLFFELGPGISQGVNQHGDKRGPSFSTTRFAMQNLLKRVGLEAYADAYPSALSGGMRQRVALARALGQNRPLMLLDEPFASLDLVTREQLYALLREIRDQDHQTIVMVTHDFRDAAALADRLLVLAKGTVVGDYSLERSSQEMLPAGTESLLQKIRLALTEI